MNKLDKLRQDILDSETFCFYPFLELSANPSGFVKPCCYYTEVLFKEFDSIDYEQSFNITKGSTLEETWNSSSVIRIRRDIKEGTPVRNCETCYRDGQASMRVRSIQEYKNNIEVLQLVSDTIDNNYEASYLPKRLELKPSNLCNLKCMMCNSYDSSQVGKELLELSKIHKGIEIHGGRFVEIKPENGGIVETNIGSVGIGTPNWSDNKEIWKSFTKIVPGLETLSFAGGEPTLIPFVEKSLRYCVDNNYAKNISVFVSSNFTNLNKSFLEMMPMFKKFELIASIDGIESVNNYCRFPSKWEQVSTNYSKAKKLMSNTNVKILTNITVNLLNVMNLDSLLYWIEDQAVEYPYYLEWPYNINLIFFPVDQRISNLPPTERGITIERLEKYKTNSKIIKEFPELVNKIDLVINELKKPYTEEDACELKRFVKRVGVLDNHRGINIINYIPDLKGLFNQ
jgi:MoaA/NifB/PqqE/SkfB family radical SAM enzyme